MPRRACLPLLIVVSISAAWPRALAAQSRAAVVSVHYESPSLVVPIAVVALRSDGGREWTLGVVGWTLGADWRHVDRPGRRRHLFVHATPFNANSSDYAYSDGKRDEASEYDGSSIEMGGGVELTHRRGWVGGYRGLALYERVSGLPAERGGERWNRPFVGVDVTEHYERVTADEPFGSRWEGIKVDGRARVLTGTHTWSQFSLRAGVGARAGRIHYSGRGEVFGGHHLDTVSAMLAGGSWDLDFAGALVGYRYGEFRLTQGAMAGGGVHLRASRDWEFGLRGNYLRSAGQSEYGAGVEMTSIWKGVRLNAGVGLPRAVLSDGGWDRAVIFATCSAAILRN